MPTRGTVVDVCRKCEDIVFLTYHASEECSSCHRVYCLYCWKKRKVAFDESECWFCTDDHEKRLFSVSESLDYCLEELGSDRTNVLSKMRTSMRIDQTNAKKRKRDDIRRAEIEEHYRKCSVCANL